MMKSMSRRSESGTTLVEVLVALAVGMLVSVIALASAQTFSGMGRLQSGQGSALAAAAGAMDAFRHDVQLSGLGFFSESSALCPRINLAFDGSVLQDAAPFAPLRIVPGANGSDRVEVAYARDVTAGAANRLLAAMAQPMDAAVLRAGATVRTGDVVLLANPAAAVPCTVATAGQTSVDATGQVSVSFASAGGFTPASWAAGFSELPAYADTASLSVLGELRWFAYEVQSDRLERVDLVTGERSVISRGVVQLRAQYGLAGSADGNTIEQWIDAQTGGGLTESDWNRLRVLRVAVVAINGEAERPSASGACDATPVAPVLWDQETAALAARAGWMCHRYRVWSTWIGLRNLQWGRDS